MPSSFSPAFCGLGLGLGVAGLDLGALGLEDLQVGSRGAQRLVAGQQEVAGEAVLDGDDVAEGAQALDAFEQNDFHVVLLHDVGEERQEAGALDGLGQFALLLGETAVMRDGTILPRSET